MDPKHFVLLLNKCGRAQFEKHEIFLELWMILNKYRIYMRNELLLMIPYVYINRCYKDRGLLYILGLEISIEKEK